jgi:phage portal protein BeeE
VRLLDRFRPGTGGSADRQITSLDDLASTLTEMYYGGLAYNLTQTYASAGDDTERVPHNYTGYVNGAYKANGIVFACMALRMLVFSEARFVYRRRRRGQAAELFGNTGLAALERPWPNGSTGDLLSRMIQDVDLAGNAYVRRVSGTAMLDRPRLERLRPDWVGIVVGSNADLLSGDVLGYVYWPGGPGSGEDPIGILREEMAHWAPYPDPLAEYRGMSWLTPGLREIAGDKLATVHRMKFFEHAATPNMVVRMDPALVSDPDQFRDFKEAMDDAHGGAWNAYKTLYLLGAADADVVGSNFQQMDFKNTTGLGETRIAALAGTHPVLVGLSEGMQGSALNAGNYGQAKRRFGDATMRPLWRSACAALEGLSEPPAGAELWFDTEDIAFLAEDRKDAAEIASIRAQTRRTYLDAGYTPDSINAALAANDEDLLVHSGLFSVQLQAPGATTAPAVGAGDDDERALINQLLAGAALAVREGRTSIADNLLRTATAIAVGSNGHQPQITQGETT